MAQIKVNIQGSGTTELTSADITALYENLTQYTDDSYMSGNATTGGAYEEEVNALMQRFPDLHIDAAKWYVKFKDSEVMRVLIANGVGDANGITIDQLDNVTNIKNWFTSNKEIKSFDELSKFKKVVSLQGNAFDGCSSLESIDLSNITELTGGYWDGLTFRNTSSLKSANLSKMTSIAGRFFLNSGIEELDISSAERLEFPVFENCKNLKIVNCKNLKSLIPINGQYPFRGSNNIEEFDEENLEGTFSITLCKDIAIFNKITKADNYFFNSNNIKKTKKIFLGRGLQSVGYDFYRGDVSGSIVFASITPPNAEGNSLCLKDDGMGYNGTKIYVPVDSVDAYKSKFTYLTNIFPVTQLSVDDHSFYERIKDLL